MTADLRATVGYDAFKKDGMGLFIKAMVDQKADAGPKIAADMQTLVESAWGQKGQAAGAMMLCRLVGYIEGMLGVVGGIHQAGVRFVVDGEDKDGRPVSMRVVLHPKDGAPDDPPKPPQSPDDIDKLEGPEYEAALAKLTPAERAKYLESA